MTAAPTPYGEVAQVIASLPLLVREARRARGLSVRAAAQQIGCSFSTISRFENGDDVNLSNAVALLRWLDQNPTDFERRSTMTDKQPSPRQVPDETRTGLLSKYHVTRREDPTGKHADCRYFVLDPKHDPLALEALHAYARAALAAGYNELYVDLVTWIVPDLVTWIVQLSRPESFPDA